MIAVMAFLYRKIFLPASFLVLRLLKPVASSKLRRIIEDREEYPVLKKLSPHPIIIHAASGEVEYAKPLIRYLRAHVPGISIVLTYFSPSALRLVEGLAVDEVLPLPFDLTRDVEPFLERINPRLVLIARTDVWPEFTRQCRLRNIPVVLFSATFSKALNRRFWLARWMDRWRFENLRLVSVVSDEDEANFQSLRLSTPTVVSGDTRYEQVIHRLSTGKALPFRFADDSRFIGVLGSMWYEDDQIWIDALADSGLRQKFRWIWVPHEVSLFKIQELAEQLKTSGFRVEKLSDIETWRSDILIVDRIGVLADLYPRADLAFVGGSFRAKVHSVMEALAAGCPVVVGPYSDNNREASEFQRLPLIDNIKVVSRAEDSEDLRAWLKRLHPHLGNRRLREQIRSLVNERGHATDRLMKELIERKIFDPARP